MTCQNLYLVISPFRDKLEPKWSKKEQISQNSDLFLDSFGFFFPWGGVLFVACSVMFVSSFFWFSVFFYVYCLLLVVCCLLLV